MCDLKKNSFGKKIGESWLQTIGEAQRPMKRKRNANDIPDSNDRRKRQARCSGEAKRFLSFKLAPHPFWLSGRNRGERTLVFSSRFWHVTVVCRRLRVHTVGLHSRGSSPSSRFEIARRNRYTLGTRLCFLFCKTRMEVFLLESLQGFLSNTLFGNLLSMALLKMFHIVLLFRIKCLLFSSFEDRVFRFTVLTRRFIGSSRKRCQRKGVRFILCENYRHIYAECVVVCSFLRENYILFHYLFEA